MSNDILRESESRAVVAHQGLLLPPPSRDDNRIMHLHGIQLGAFWHGFDSLGVSQAIEGVPCRFAICPILDPGRPLRSMLFLGTNAGVEDSHFSSRFTSAQYCFQYY